MKGSLQVKGKKYDDAVRLGITICGEEDLGEFLNE